MTAGEGVTTAVRPALRPAPDRVLLAAVGMLALAGMVAIYTAGASTGFETADATGRGAFFLRRHLVWLLFGGTLATLAYATDHRVWRRHSLTLFAGLVAVLAAMAIVSPEGRYGGERWIFGGSVQPSEMAKLVVVVYMADWLAGRTDEIKQWSLGIVPFSILVGSVCGLIIMQRDYSTAVLILAIASTMLFVAGADLRQMVVAGLVAVAVLAVFVVTVQYRLQRIQTWIGGAPDPSGAGYQIDKALASFRAGGLFGVGLGNGQFKHAFPPNTAHTDGIFAVIGEETGVLGGLVVVGLFAVLTWRGLRTARGLDDRFGGLVAVGITSWLCIQAMINMAVATALIPFTGIPMPFISYGGSSLAACMLATGLLLNLSARSRPERARLYEGLDRGGRDRRAHLSRARRARSVGRAGGQRHLARPAPGHGG